MLKVALTILAVLISAYWIGERIRRNPKIDKFLSALEGGYSKLNERLEESTIMDGLRLLRKYYGWISVALFICILVVQRLPQSTPMATLRLFSVFGFAFMGWFSIKWVTEHKSTIVEISRDNVLIVFGPLLLGIFDILFGTPFMDILARPMREIATLLHFDLPLDTNPIAIGSITSLAVLGFFGFYYLLTWIVTAPVFLISVFVVLLPIRFARLLAAIDRTSTFLWLTLFVMLGISVWLSQL
ncbi:hypothetical protein [Chitinimonas taiwanensis]|nr:hypothetical protein [Chitinimonas taiwanensis]